MMSLHGLKVQRPQRPHWQVQAFR